MSDSIRTGKTTTPSTPDVREARGKALKALEAARATLGEETAPVPEGVPRFLTECSRYYIAAQVYFDAAIDAAEAGNAKLAALYQAKGKVFLTMGDLCVAS